MKKRTPRPEKKRAEKGIPRHWQHNDFISSAKCVIGDTMGDGSKADWTCDGDTANKDGVCDSCKAAGWSANPIEVAASIARDPTLSKVIPIRGNLP